MRKKDGEQVILPGGEGGLEILRLGRCLVYPGQFQRGTGAFDHHRFVLKKGEGQIGVTGHVGVVMVSQHGIQGDTLGDRFEEPAYHRFDVGLVAGLGSKIAGDQEKVIIQCKELFLGCLDDPVPPAEVQIGDVSDAQARRGGGQTIHGNGELSDND